MDKFRMVQWSRAGNEYDWPTISWYGNHSSRWLYCHTVSSTESGLVLCPLSFNDASYERNGVRAANRRSFGYANTACWISTRLRNLRAATALSDNIRDNIRYADQPNWLDKIIRYADQPKHRTDSSSSSYGNETDLTRRYNVTIRRNAGNKQVVSVRLISCFIASLISFICQPLYIIVCSIISLAANVVTMLFMCTLGLAKRQVLSDHRDKWQFLLKNEPKISFLNVFVHIF